jgi:hypothetical protein
VVVPAVRNLLKKAYIMEPDPVKVDVSKLKE